MVYNANASASDGPQRPGGTHSGAVTPTVINLNSTSTAVRVGALHGDKTSWLIEPALSSSSFRFPKLRLPRRITSSNNSQSSSSTRTRDDASGGPCKHKGCGKVECWAAGVGALSSLAMLPLDAILQSTTKFQPGFNPGLIHGNCIRGPMGSVPMQRRPVNWVHSGWQMPTRMPTNLNGPSNINPTAASAYRPGYPAASAGIVPQLQVAPPFGLGFKFENAAAVPGLAHGYRLGAGIVRGDVPSPRILAWLTTANVRPVPALPISATVTAVVRGSGSSQADPRLPISARPTNIRVGRSRTRKLYEERLVATRTRLLAATTALKELWENDTAMAEMAAAASGQNEVDPLLYSSHSAAGTDPDRVSESTGGSGSRSDPASQFYSASSSDHTSDIDWDDSEQPIQIQKSRATLEYEWELESLETIIEVGRLQERHLVASLEMLARQ